MADDHYFTRRTVLAGGIVLPFCPSAGAQTSGRALTPEAFGAKGDGATDDTGAFQAMARRLEDLGTGTVSLRAGAIYRIGRQVRGDTAGPAYLPQSMFSVAGLNGLAIEGNGATLKLNDGLHYGSFDPATGNRFDPPKGKFTDPRYAATVGSMIKITDSRRIRIRNLIVDGNAGKAVVGGRWSVNIQLPYDGIRLLDVADVLVENVMSRNHGLDGIYLRGRTRKVAAEAADALRFSNVRCVRNGRQGVSVVGGSGISFADCLFADTGQGGISSAPGAGVDIEPNGRDWASDLLFERCEFRNNRGVGLVAAQGASRGIVARDCTFWQGFAPGEGGRGSGDAFWLVRPGAVIDRCKVHGNVTNLTGDAVVRRSSFDDAVLRGYGRAAQQRRYLVAGARGTFEDCSFTVTGTGARALVYAKNPITFRRCTMHHAGQALPANVAAAVFGDTATLQNVRFTEALRQPSPTGNYIAVGKPNLLGQVTVAGPHIRWGAANGRIGNVAGSGR